MTTKLKNFFSRHLPLLLSLILVMAGGVVFLFLPKENQKQAEAAWYSSSWSYRKPITIDKTKISTVATTTFSNFPMLISVTDTDLKHTSFSGKVGKTDGADILFTSSDGSTKLNHEIERYSSSTGEILIWVQIPTLSGTSDTLIYMYFGNSGASDQQSINNTWDSNYKGVYHLPDGTTLTANDSTSNANNGTLTNTPTATTGKIGGGGSFVSASSQYISLGNGASLQNATTTIEAWIKLNGTSGYRAIWGNSGNGYEFRVNTTSNILQTLKQGVAGVITGNKSLVPNTWYNVIFVNDTNDSRIYINGMLDAVAASASGVSFSNNRQIAGASTVSEYLDGQIDEVRNSSIARSSDWIKTSFNNQSSPSTFYAYGSLGIQNRATTTAGVAMVSRSGNASPTRQNFYVESDTATSTTSTSYVDSGSVLTFTPDISSSYFIFGSYQLNSNGLVKALGRIYNSTVQATTSESSITLSNTGDYFALGGMGIYTSTSTAYSQTFKIQFSAISGNTTNIKNTRLAAIKKHSLDEYAQVTTSSSTTQTAYQDFTTLTFTPATAGDYIILASADLNYDSSSLPDVQVDIDGAAYGVVNSIDSPGTNDFYNYSYALKANLSASSHTLKIQWRRNSNGSGAAVKIRNGIIIALRADALNSNFSDQSFGRITTLNTTCQEKLFTQQPTASSTYLVFSSGVYDTPSQTSSSAQMKFLEGSNIKAEGIYRGRNPFVTQAAPFFTFYRGSFTGGSSSWSSQYKSSAGANIGASYVSIVGFQLESASVRPPNIPAVKIKGGVKFR